MEKKNINYVLLQGFVGSSTKTIVSGDKTLYRFCFATNESYETDDGILCNTTWHTISVWSGNQNVDYESIKKGSYLRIEGVLQTDAFYEPNGVKRFATIVRATSIKLAE